jgi:uncharacterized repeat protein (TIGR03803 family)
VQAVDGDFYGTTDIGGVYGDGTVFKITPSGILTTLHTFNGTDGASPLAGLVQAPNGDFYGTTYRGGAYSGGTVFKIAPGGTFTTLYSFCAKGRCIDGLQPGAALVQATNGDFYGTTYFGGADDFGTVFKITPSGSLTTLHSFCAEDGCPDGEYPLAPLVQGTDGNFYGTTNNGGAHGNFGTIFKITAGGTLTTLYSFCAQSGCADGAPPWESSRTQMGISTGPRLRADLKIMARSLACP